jgi:hypothetical protein
MLRGRDLTGLLPTLDARHTQRATARLIVAQHGHYLMVVKANQPDNYTARSEWFTEPDWGVEEAVERVTTTTKGHGRREWRTVERRTTRSLAHLWPGAQQAVRRHCVSVRRSSGVRREEVTFALKCLPAGSVSAAHLEA